MQTTFQLSTNKFSFNISDFYFTKQNNAFVVDFGNFTCTQGPLFQLKTLLVKSVGKQIYTNALVSLGENETERAFKQQGNFFFNNLSIEKCKTLFDTGLPVVKKLFQADNNSQAGFVALFYLANCKPPKNSFENFSIGLVNICFSKLLTKFNLNIVSLISQQNSLQQPV